MGHLAVPWPARPRHTRGTPPRPAISQPPARAAGPVHSTPPHRCVAPQSPPTSDWCPDAERFQAKLSSHAECAAAATWPRTQGSRSPSPPTAQPLKLQRGQLQIITVDSAEPSAPPGEPTICCWPCPRSCTLSGSTRPPGGRRMPSTWPCTQRPFGARWASFGFTCVPATLRASTAPEVLRQLRRDHIVSLLGPAASHAGTDAPKDWTQDPLTATALDQAGAGHHTATHHTSVAAVSGLYKRGSAPAPFFKNDVKRYIQSSTSSRSGSNSWQSAIAARLPRPTYCRLGLASTPGATPHRIGG